MIRVKPKITYMVNFYMLGVNMKKSIWIILLVVSGLLFLTETALLIQDLMIEPLDSNLLVTFVYFLTFALFIISTYKTISKK